MKEPTAAARTIAEVGGAAIEDAIDAVIACMPIRGEKLFVGADGLPQPLIIRFADMAELRNFFHATLTIGIKIAKDAENAC